MKNNKNIFSESQRNMNRPKETETILPNMYNTINIVNNDNHINNNEHNIVNNIVFKKKNMTISRQISNNCNNIVLTNYNIVFIVNNIVKLILH